MMAYFHYKDILRGLIDGNSLMLVRISNFLELAVVLVNKLKK